MISAIDISTSRLVAQRIRLNAISSNLENMSTLINENGEVAPYQPKFVAFQTNDSLKTQHGAVDVKVGGVHTQDVEPKYKFQLNHPLVIKVGPRAGYIAYPSINMIEEFVMPRKQRERMKSTSA